MDCPYFGIVDFDDPVSHGCDGLVMRDDDDCRSGIEARILQQLEHLFARFVIQCPCRLVAKQQLGLLRQGAGNSDALLFASRELRREVVHALAQAYFPHDFGSIAGMRRYLRGKLHVLLRRQVRHQIIELEDETDIPSSVGRQGFRYSVISVSESNKSSSSMTVNNFR